MYYENWLELVRGCPLKDKKWDREVLYEYLVWSCSKEFRQPLDDFFSRYQDDKELAGLLFDFLLNDEYDGSDCQMGAAYYISRLNREILRDKKELLLRAQENTVLWKKPFPDKSYLELTFWSSYWRYNEAEKGHMERL